VIADIAHIGHAELLTPDLAASTELFTADPPLRTWTAAERVRGVGWGTRLPPSWLTYGTPPVAVDA
jgi:hypothetical protein